jgi:hypothetical protein
MGTSRSSLATELVAAFFMRGKESRAADTDDRSAMAFVKEAFLS